VTAWLIAVAAGASVAAYQYGTSRAPSPWRRVALATMRMLAVTGAMALVLDAPLGRAIRAEPLVFVDGSRSMTRGDSTVWHAARDSATALGDSAQVFGDSVAAWMRASPPAANRSRARSVVERAMADGRPAIVITDGELEDSSALDGLGAGSRVIVLPRRAHRDLAVAAIEAPRAAVQGDSLAIRVTLSSASEGAAPGALVVRLGDAQIGRWPVDAMSPWSERQVDVRVRAQGAQGPTPLTVIASSQGDSEPRNDTLGVAVEISRAATAVFVSTSPDQDARFAMAVLRGALSLPTRGYLRIAPGRWRHEGTFAAATEAEVRLAVRDAPVTILHGDTSIFGPPQAATRGPLALIVPPESEDGEWYPSSVPPSPLSAALAAVPLESLPPVAAGAPARGDWVGVEARRGREDVRRAIVSGRDSPRRIAVITGSGFWRWRFRGGASADAYAALWGGIFDWLAAERADSRDAVPDEQLVRAGDPVRWRRGSAADSNVRVVLQRRRATRVDTLHLRFPPGVAAVDAAGLDAGVYDVQVPNGRALLVVNQSAELLPARPRLQSGSIGTRSYGHVGSGARRFGWFYALVIALLCTEWVARRRAGLR